MLQMYKGAINSPETIITNNISNTDTLIYVQDETKVPTDLPNLMVLGTGISAETIKVLSISGLAITVERAFQGTAKTWNAGTTIARNFTEYDYEALKSNVEELTENQGDLTLLETVEQSNLVGAINENTAQLAQIKQHTIFITRDISLGGVQAITLPFKAKGMTVISAIPNTKNESTAVWAENGTQISRARRGSDDLYIVSSNVIRVYLNADNYISGVVQNVTETGFEILWTKTGSPTGTVNTVILASSYADGGA